MDLVKEEIFVPLFLRHPTRKPALFITRKDVIDDRMFYAEYEAAVEDDLQDIEFLNIARSLKLDPAEIAFSFNWDLLICQILRASLIVENQMMPLLQFKLRSVLRDTSSIAEIPIPVRRHEVVNRFLYRTVGKLPRELTVKEIIDFRANKRAMNFRNWLSLQLSKVAKAKDHIDIDVDEELMREYDRLVSEYRDKSRLTSTVSVGIAAGLAGMIAGPLLSASAAVLGPMAFSRLLSRIWRSKGSANWAFFLLNLKDSRRKNR